MVSLETFYFNSLKENITEEEQGRRDDSIQSTPKIKLVLK